MLVFVFDFQELVAFEHRNFHMSLTYLMCQFSLTVFIKLFTIETVLSLCSGSQPFAFAVPCFFCQLSIFPLSIVSAFGKGNNYSKKAPSWNPKEMSSTKDSRQVSTSETWPSEEGQSQPGARRSLSFLEHLPEVRPTHPIFLCWSVGFLGIPLFHSIWAVSVCSLAFQAQDIISNLILRLPFVSHLMFGMYTRLLEMMFHCNDRNSK